MRDTTFDFRTALRGNHASPHGEDADGKMRVSDQSANYTIVAYRPAGGVWTSAHDFARYAELELSKGTLPGGKRLVSEENLVARRLPQVQIGEDHTYGMGLMVNTRWGTPVVHHGGDLLGYHSDFFVLPEHGVGAVILTNADNGELIRGPLMRRLLEVLFDGNPEAEGDVAAQAKRVRAEQEKLRSTAGHPARADGRLRVWRASTGAPSWDGWPSSGVARQHRRGRGRVEDRGGHAPERRWLGLAHHHRPQLRRLRVRGGREGRQAGADHPRRTARVRLHRGRLVDPSRTSAAPRSSSSARRIERWHRVSSSQ